MKRRRHRFRGGYVGKKIAKKAKAPKKVRNADGRVHVKGHTRGYPYNSIL